MLNGGHAHGHGVGAYTHEICWPTDICVNPASSCGGHTSESSSESYNENFNIRAAFLHVVGDIIQSIGVVVAAIIIFINVRMFIKLY